MEETSKNARNKKPDAKKKRTYKKPTFVDAVYLNRAYGLHGSIEECVMDMQDVHYNISLETGDDDNSWKPFKTGTAARKGKLSDFAQVEMDRSRLILNYVERSLKGMHRLTPPNKRYDSRKTANEIVSLSLEVAEAAQDIARIVIKHPTLVEYVNTNNLEHMKAYVDLVSKEKTPSLPKEVSLEVGNSDETDSDDLGISR